MSLQVFVINLDRSPGRLARFAAAGIPFERFPAVDGIELPERVKPYFCNSDGKIASPLKAAEIGCYASHLSVWQRIVDESLPAALVCEDDAIVPSGIEAIVDDVLSALPIGWDMVLLASKPSLAFRPLQALPDGHTLIRHSRVPGGLVCYLMSQAGAVKMLRPGLRMWAADQDTRWPWKFSMDTYGVHPQPVGFIVGHSTINPGGRRSGGRSGLRRGWRLTPARSVSGLLFNLRQLGPYWWTRCFVANYGAKLRKMLRPIARLPQVVTGPRAP